MLRSHSGSRSIIPVKLHPFRRHHHQELGFTKACNTKHGQMMSQRCSYILTETPHVPVLYRQIVSFVGICLPYYKVT